jgi:hypothetical protein
VAHGSLFSTELLVFAVAWLVCGFRFVIAVYFLLLLHLSGGLVAEEEDFFVVLSKTVYLKYT